MNTYVDMCTWQPLHIRWRMGLDMNLCLHICIYVIYVYLNTYVDMCTWQPRTYVRSLSTPASRQHQPTKTDATSNCAAVPICTCVHMYISTRVYMHLYIIYTDTNLCILRYTTFNTRLHTAPADNTRRNHIYLYVHIYINYQ